MEPSTSVTESSSPTVGCHAGELYTDTMWPCRSQARLVNVSSASASSAATSQSSSYQSSSRRRTGPRRMSPSFFVDSPTKAMSEGARSAPRWKRSSTRRKEAKRSTREAIRKTKSITSVVLPFTVPVSRSIACRRRSSVALSTPRGEQTISLIMSPWLVASMASSSTGAKAGTRRSLDAARKAPGSKSAASATRRSSSERSAWMRSLLARKFSMSGMRRYGAVRYERKSSASVAPSAPSKDGSASMSSTSSSVAAQSGNVSSSTEACDG